MGAGMALEVSKITKTNIKEEEKELILGKNAEKLLNL